MMAASLYDRVSRLSEEHRKVLIKQLHDLKDQNPSTANEQLIAYVTGESVDLSELRNHLEKHLPEYMMPGTIIQLDQLPKLPNGKIDVEALRSYNHDLVSGPTESSEPSNKIEKLLVDIWQEVLGFEPIGINDNFFEIGGDSILSIQIVARAGRAGIELAPTELFERQTIAQLAKKIRQTD